MLALVIGLSVVVGVLAVALNREVRLRRDAEMSADLEADFREADQGIILRLMAQLQSDANGTVHRDAKGRFTSAKG